ncbi:uncharacterized protein LOC133901286 isoform X2 [Phragmites australis]|uniref:uncharacterized protein LOC133901286 isoform X2 n=1 Tax=Phragmites australis TaxID=29695 RepID=UPI002D78447A|nr:uncharacterized protein LOC133901286 isoform X2 [Phragmites australis]
MRNASGSWWCSRVALLQQVLVPQAASHGFGQLLGAASPGMDGDHEVMPPLLFRALASLNLILLLVYLLLVLLAKLSARLHLRATAKDRTGWDHDCDHRAETTKTEDVVAADIVGGQQANMLLWFDEAVFEDSSLLSDEGKDHLYTTTATPRCLQVEGTFPAEESARISPSEGHHIDAAGQQQKAKDIAVDVTDQWNVPAVTSPENVPIEGNLLGKKESSREEDARRDDDNDRDEHAEEVDKGFSEGHVKLFVNNRALADTRKLLLEGVVAGGGRQLKEEKDRDSGRFGESTLTSESTSKSSVEWRSATVTKDSETEYPFSSSSRRSSARWESYTLFRKYDEDMVYFHRVGAQKLTEIESFRSIKYRPRSMSERIVRKLTPKPSAPIGLRDPYPDLESAYVAQVCLTWEALNWNYTSFRRYNVGDGNIAARCCPARVAQEFQQFQVLLHRFIENELYECGRRPEVYARMKNWTPKLLLVPEFRGEDDEKDDLISAVQFLLILEESIRTFMNFLRADKRSHYEMFREMVKRRSSAVDQTLVITLKKANKKKRSRLKDLTRPRRCLKRTKLREEEELSILLGLIDLKVVARVLRMPEVTDQQLHWCEEKMNRVRVDPEGRMQRDTSLLFFPGH